MAHVVVSSSSLSGANDDLASLKKKGIKEIRQEDVIERRKEDARDRVELERKRVREGEIAKRRLRVLATQRCQTEQETIEALEQINQMSPEDALRTLDLHLAKAEAGFADNFDSRWGRQHSGPFTPSQWLHQRSLPIGPRTAVCTYKRVRLHCNFCEQQGGDCPLGC